MGAIPEQSFTVRNPAWWDTGAVFDLDHYPSREEAMRLAGHDWDVLELPSFTAIPFGYNGAQTAADNPEWKHMGNGYVRKDDGFKSHLRSDNLFLLAKSKESFERIPNSDAWDIGDVLFDQGFQNESAGSLEGGRQCYITLKLNEPITIPGDDSIVLPFGSLSWAHDGSGALKVRSGTIRQVCQNTVSASEAEGQRLGTNFVFRHTKNWRERVEDAKQAIKGVRKSLDVFRQMAEELADISVTPAQRDLYVSEIIGDRNGLLSMSPSTSDRVKNNIESERAKVNSLFMGPTIPEAHKLSAYGLHCAGVEYFDHLRNYRSKESYVKRTLLTDNPAKASLIGTIRELVKA